MYYQEYKNYSKYFMRDITYPLSRNDLSRETNP